MATMLMRAAGHSFDLLPLRTFQELLPLARHVIHAAQDKAKTGASRVEQRPEELTGDAARDATSCLSDVQPRPLRQQHVGDLLP